MDLMLSFSKRMKRYRFDLFKLVSIDLYTFACFSMVHNFPSTFGGRLMLFIHMCVTVIGMSCKGQPGSALTP